MKLMKTDLETLARRLGELEKTGLDVESFRHNNMIIHVAHDSNQKDGAWYWITSIESPGDPTPGPHPQYPPGVR